MDGKVFGLGRPIITVVQPSRSWESTRPEVTQRVLHPETGTIKIGDEVDLQYYRLERVHSGAIDLKQGEVQAIKGPTELGTGKAKDEKAPLSEIIDVLNERFGTEFTEEDRLFFQQIKEKAVKNEHVIQTALAKSDRQV